MNMKEIKRTIKNLNDGEKVSFIPTIGPPEDTPDKPVEGEIAVDGVRKFYIK